MFTAGHLTLVIQIQELFQAGFCSTVIEELLPVLGALAYDAHRLNVAFDAARVRLESEKGSIESELSALSRLKARLGLAPDTRVSVQDGGHDTFTAASSASFDHRDRRLR